MKTQQEQLTLFLDAIKGAGHKEAAQIIKEADEYREAELTAVREVAEAQSDELLKQESASTMAEANRLVSAERKRLLGVLADRRAELAARIAEDTREKLFAFTATDDYKEFLAASLREIAEVFGGKTFSLSVRAADLNYTKTLCEEQPLVTSVSVDETILLGGFRALRVDGKASLDDTLDTRLETEQNWLYETYFL